MKKEMNKDVFWMLIDGARLSSTDPDVRYSNMVDMLSMLDAAAIGKWQGIMDVYWKAAFKRKLWATCHVIDEISYTAKYKHRKTHNFYQFVARLVSQGKDVYMRVLANPDSLADMALTDDNFLLAGSRFHVVDFLSKEEESAILSKIVYADDINDKYTSEDLLQCLPRLCTKYGWDGTAQLANFLDRRVRTQNKI